MPQVVIENPVINSPFDEPSRHFKFDETGITNDIAINNSGQWSRWAITEVDDPWAARRNIESQISAATRHAAARAKE